MNDNNHIVGYGITTDITPAAEQKFDNLLNGRYGGPLYALPWLSPGEHVHGKIITEFPEICIRIVEVGWPDLAEGGWSIRTWRRQKYAPWVGEEEE